MKGQLLMDIDCLKSGPGPVQHYFAGPGPGPLGPVAMCWPWTWTSVDPGQRVRARSSPGPDLALMKKIKIYTFIIVEASYGTTYNHLEKNFFPV